MADTVISQIPQGYYSPKAICLSGSVQTGTLNGANDVICSFVLPCAARVVKADYVITTSANNLTDVTLTHGSTDITTAFDHDAGARTAEANTLLVTTAGDYAAGSIIKLQGGFSGSTTVSDTHAVLTIQPITGV